MQIPHNERGIQPGPLATFPKWKELGRHVKKGEKALAGGAREAARERSLATSSKMEA
jgi:N-terminal domain of anti-restriction factor ArdC